MHCDFTYADLTVDAQWKAFRRELDPDGSSLIIKNLLALLRDGGAVFAVEESTYIDRDFSAAYASFYSTLYQMRPRHCRRVHFFASSVSDAFDGGDLTDIAHGLEATGDDYLGFIVIRPLQHAPVGSAVIATRCATAPGVEISVRSTYKVHFLGAELSVEGVPVTEQDTRTGSCAQATIWTAGRHFHNRHSTPWFSVPDITEAALKPTDSILAKSLPAGSDYLTDDNMVRALRAMGEHPIVYAPEAGSGWEEPPARTIARYLDSGIPVIIGLRQGAGIGHAVVAVGTVMAPAKAKSPDGDAHMADRITHLIVNDDQNGAYRRIAVASPKRLVSSADYTLTDAIFLLVPLPSKVYMKAEVAETLARDKLRFVSANRTQHIKEGRSDIKPADWAVDPEFYATKADKLVARTYLTHGWKYKHRLLRNAVVDDLREELAFVQLPRYVWVTEFSLPGDVASLDPCQRKVRAHVVLDATGSRFEDSVLLTHLPGIIIGQSFDPANPSAEPITSLRVLLEDAPYYPKIRGMADFVACIPAAVSAANDVNGDIAA